MTQRFLLLVCLFAVSGCNCFVPVEECVGIRCTRLPDGGRRDGGVDAGRTDGGPRLDAGAAVACAVWDGGGVGKCAAITGYVWVGTSCQGECVLYPISTPGVYATLAECVSCGCDATKFKTNPPGQPVGPGTYCDVLSAVTTLPRLISEAFSTGDGGYDAGCAPFGAVEFECPVWTRTLGDAGYARGCAATLVPYVSEVRCRIFF